ncbi:MAG: galactosyldiacylglycerol synthase [Rubrivivax sp.]|jgi:1,2-diacylglycerol 3-beta-galactosyltransferase|nr:galactosyldiacylglycerol synthase [Rubrivivax sp.]
MDSSFEDAARPPVDGALPAVDLVYFNAGGGHRAAAEALRSLAAMQGRRWRVRTLNLFDVLDPAGRFERITGFAPEDYYNKRLARGWTIGLAQELKILQAMIRAAHPWMVERLAAHWQATRPDLVVSLVPNVNRALHDGLARGRPGAPFATVLTDFADLPPHFWIERGQRQHLVCGTGRAYAQALAAGHAPRRVHRVSGMILRPSFYAPPRVGRDEARAALGLDPAQPVGAVLFGGHGSRVMKRIAARLPDVPLVLLCGHNAALADELRALPARAPRVVVGHTADVAHYLRLADFLVGKPGPGSVSEALHCGLPVIVTRNAFTMPQERYNTEWVRDQGVGLVLESFADIEPAVARMLAALPSFRERVQRHRNRAVFEVAELIDRWLATAPVPEGATPAAAV